MRPTDTTSHGAGGATRIGAVVLGMGRSGTSAITRALVAAGFYAGADAEMMAPNPANPVGFYENLGIYSINEAILARTGASWFAPPTEEAQAGVAADVRLVIRDAVARLKQDGDGSPLAVKDPRIGVLLEIWKPVIETELHPVLAVRNPAEIAASLAERDGTPTALVLASWELHMARVLRHLQGRQVTVAPYARLLGSREAVTGLVESVLSQLIDDCSRRVDPALAWRAIEPELYRARAPDYTLADQLTRHQQDLWSYLEGLTAGTQRLAVPERLTREGDIARALTLAETRRVQTEQRVQELDADLARETRRGAEAEATLAEVRSRLEASEQAGDQARLAQERAEHWLSVVQGSTSWRITAPLRGILGVLRWLRDRLAVTSPSSRAG